jgi:hypothetical protein
VVRIPPRQRGGLLKPNRRTANRETSISASGKKSTSGVQHESEPPGQRAHNTAYRPDGERAGKKRCAVTLDSSQNGGSPSSWQSHFHGRQRINGRSTHVLKHWLCSYRARRDFANSCDRFARARSTKDSSTPCESVKQGGAYSPVVTNDALIRFVSGPAGPGRSLWVKAGHPFFPKEEAKTALRLPSTSGIFPSIGFARTKVVSKCQASRK